MEADLTVIFGDVSSSGSKVTIDYCKNDNVPYLINPDAEELREYARMIEAETINVAGNRESKNMGIQERVRKVIVEAFGG